METSDHLPVVVYAASPEYIEQDFILFGIGWLRGYRLSLPFVDDLRRVQSRQKIAAVHEVHQTLLICRLSRIDISFSVHGQSPPYSGLYSTQNTFIVSS